MKKLLWPLMALLVLAGAGCAGGDVVSETVSQDELLKIAVTADVELKRPGGTEASTCLGSGAFMFDFFVDGRTDQYDADGTMQLTDYNCLLIGNTAECVVEPLESAYTQRPVTGRLSYTDSGKRMEFYLPTFAGTDSLEILWDCPNGEPGVTPDMALMTQLQFPLVQERLEVMPHAGKTKEVVLEDVALNMGVFADVYLTYTTTITTLN
jgi:hypothetical protein